MSAAPRNRKGPPAGEARETITAPIGSLVANPRNPRRHSEDQINRLMAALSRDGQTKPVLARRENRMLIAGHGVHQAATRLGFEHIEVVLLDVPQADADRMMLSDNRQSDLSTHNDDAVAALLREIHETDWLATGYSEAEVAKVLKPVEPKDLQVFEIETSDRQDKFWISVHGPMPDQARAIARLREVMAEMPAVTVEIGTTPDLS